MRQIIVNTKKWKFLRNKPFKMNSTSIIKLFSLLLVLSATAFGTENPVEEKELPIGFTPEEWERRHEIRSLGRETDPPPHPVRNVAEYEKMQGVLIRYSFGLPTSLIADFSQHVIVYCLVSNSQQGSAFNSLNNAGANMDNVEFIIGNTNSYWTRDYGPWWIVTDSDSDGERELSVMDFTYNRPRPYDNQAPQKMSDHLNTPLYSMILVHAGGNYMTDSYGISSSTSLVYNENADPLLQDDPLTSEEVDAVFWDYLNIDTYHVVDDPNNEYIQHIDCWGKYLSPSKVLIREVPSSHAQYDEIEEVVDYFENQTDDWGNSYEIYRVYTPNNQPYTNSLILNEKVYVPTMNSSWDDDALAAYQEAMPDYEILGYYYSSWVSTDALHCRAKGIPDLDMIEILLNSIETGPSGYAVNVSLDALSGVDLTADELLLYWKSPSMTSFNTELLSPSGNEEEYSATIPQQSNTSELRYYVSASDAGGNENRMPLAGYYTFEATEMLMGDVDQNGTVDITDIILAVNFMLGSGNLTETQQQIADLNHDGSIDIFDIIQIVNIMLGN